MAYSEKVLDHYENPRNVGVLDAASKTVGTGMVGAPACGDVMRLQIKIDDTNKCIAKINTSLLQIKWSVYGALGYYIITQIGIVEALKVAL